MEQTDINPPRATIREVSTGLLHPHGHTHLLCHSRRPLPLQPNCALTQKHLLRNDSHVLRDQVLTRRGLNYCCRERARAVDDVLAILGLREYANAMIGDENVTGYSNVSPNGTDGISHLVAFSSLGESP